MAPKRRPLKDFTSTTGMRADLYCRVSLIQETGDRAMDEKSVDDQEREGRAWAERAGVTLGEVFRDPGISASRYAAKGRDLTVDETIALRPDFKRLMDHVKTGKTDIVWVWAIDRSQRDLKVFGELRDVFQRHQVALSVSGKVYDPNDYDGWMLLGITSFFGERYSHELSKNVTRGKRSSAMSGRPSGRVAYGYSRVYDPTTRQLLRQEPNVWDGDGHAVEDSPAWVIREIFRRIAAGESLHRISRDLDERDIPTPGANSKGTRYGWNLGKVRSVALNPIYIGVQTYHGEIVDLPDGVEPMWPPLVDKETFWAVHRILTDPTRKTTRPSAAKSLLTSLLVCGKCGGAVVNNYQHRRKYRYYVCHHRGCTSINADLLDDYVEAATVKYLSDPEIFADLTRVDDSTIATQARTDAAEARAQLQQLYADQKKGLVSATIATIEESRLLEVVAEAEKRAQEATLPPVLHDRTGPEAEAKWNRATNEIRRQLIAAIAEITIKPNGRAGKSRPMPERVEWRWLIGPDAD